MSVRSNNQTQKIVFDELSKKLIMIIRRSISDELQGLIFSTEKEKNQVIQGSKLTLADSQNASDFDELRVRKLSTSKRLRVRIIHVSQTFGENLLVEKNLTSQTLQVD